MLGPLADSSLEKGTAEKGNAEKGTAEKSMTRTKCAFGTLPTV
jgi:hypothetical protein